MRRKPFHVVWVTRSFLDYRIPVFEEMNRLTDGNFHLVYSKEFTPERVWRKVEDILGGRAIGLIGEKSLGYKGNITGERANSRLRIPYQPGLLELLKKLSPDVLIGDGFFQWTWPAFLRRLISGTPLVVCYERTAHTERYAQWYRNLFRKMMVRYIGSMCVNGRLSKEYVESLGALPQSIAVGHMVADTKQLQVRIAHVQIEESKALKKRLGLDADTTVFLSVARLIELKGFRQLLEGWRHFKKSQAQQSALVLVGDGPQRTELENYCMEHSLSDVHFVGAVDYDEIHQYFAICDMFVIATLEDNWSLVVPEAMACGKPILCSIYNGCWPELVHDGVNGWTFDPLDNNSIVAALKKCVAPSVDLLKMGAESKRIVADESPERAAKAILDACCIAMKRKIESI